MTFNTLFLKLLCTIPYYSGSVQPLGRAHSVEAFKGSCCKGCCCAVKVSQSRSKIQSKPPSYININACIRMGFWERTLRFYGTCLFYQHWPHCFWQQTNTKHGTGWVKRKCTKEDVPLSNHIYEIRFNQKSAGKVSIILPDYFNASAAN